MAERQNWFEWVVIVTVSKMMKSTQTSVPPEHLELWHWDLSDPSTTWINMNLFCRQVTILQTSLCWKNVLTHVSYSPVFQNGKCAICYL